MTCLRSMRPLTFRIIGCDCCMYNGSLVPEGGWTVLADGSNATCCDGNLVVETLSNCRIEAFAYQECK
mgnify:CR=1 FL=1